MTKEDKFVLKKEKLMDKNIKKLLKMIKESMNLNEKMTDSGMFSSGYNNLALENVWYQIEHLMFSLCMTAGIMNIKLDELSYLLYSSNDYTQQKLDEIINYWNQHYKTNCKYITKGRW